MALSKLQVCQFYNYKIFTNIINLNVDDVVLPITGKEIKSTILSNSHNQTHDVVAVLHENDVNLFPPCTSVCLGSSGFPTSFLESYDLRSCCGSGHKTLGTRLVCLLGLIPIRNFINMSIANKHEMHLMSTVYIHNFHYKSR